MPAKATLEKDEEKEEKDEEVDFLLLERVNVRGLEKPMLSVSRTLRVIPRDVP
jgi:hypothetical protein